MNLDNLQEEIDAITNLVSIEGQEDDCLKRLHDLNRDIFSRFDYAYSMIGVKEDPKGNTKAVGSANYNDELSNEIKLALQAPQVILGILSEDISPSDAMDGYNLVKDLSDLLHKIANSKAKEIDKDIESEMQRMPDELKEYLRRKLGL